jgi:hypothetical protein
MHHRKGYFLFHLATLHLQLEVCRTSRLGQILYACDRQAATRILAARLFVDHSRYPVAIMQS